MLLAAQQDFEPATPEEGAAALYYEPGNANGITGYRQFDFFQHRIDQLKGRLAPNNQKLAIWGCAFGYLVQLAVTAGYDAYGFDASPYAITRAKQIQSAVIGARIFQRDATLSTDVTQSRRDAGLTGNQRFALLLTEDMLTCLTDAEIQTALPLLRGSCSANLGHMLTVLERAGTGNDPRINWKATAAWKSLLSPPDQIISSVDGTVL
jgi:hypothetical protein